MSDTVGGAALGVSVPSPVSPAVPPAAPPGTSPPRTSPPRACPRGRGGVLAGHRVAAALRWGLAALAALACLMMLSWPLGYDQGVFASVGDIVARGGAPYRDAWDVKGPLVFYMSAAIQLVFGRHAWGVRVVDVGLALLTAGLLWRRLRTVTSPAAALTTAAVWPVFVAALTYDESAQYDLWVGTAMLAVTLLITRRGGYRPRDLILAGALVGLASLTKPIFPVFLAVPGVVVVTRRRSALAAVARDLGLLVAGWLAPIVTTLAALWWQGALHEMWEVHILYNLRVYAPAVHNGQFSSASPVVGRVKGLLAFVARAPVALLLAPAAAGAAVLWRRDRVLAAAVLTWLAGGVGLVLLQNKFWPYHWEIIDAALLVLVAVGVHGAAAGARASGRRAAAVMAYTGAGVAFALNVWGVALDLGRWGLYVVGRRSEAWYDASFDRYGEIHPAAQRAVAAYLRAHTPEGAPFAHWTTNAALAFLAGRPNASRFQNKRELVVTRQHPITQGYRREYLERVRALQPTYIAVGPPEGAAEDTARAATAPPNALAQDFPELAALLAERYTLEVRIGDVDLYRASRRPGVAPTAWGR